MIDLDSTGPNVSQHDISLLEGVAGKELPEDYKKFLIQHNGGIPTANLEVAVPGAAWSPTDLQLFLGINKPIETSNIVWYLDQLGFQAGELLPIGCDSGGGLFCLHYRSRAATGVVYLDWQGEELYQIADSFSDFIGQLLIA